MCLNGRPARGRRSGDFPVRDENILIVAERRGRIAPQDISDALTLLKRVQIAVDPFALNAMGRHIDLARRPSLSPYDAAILHSRYLAICPYLRPTLGWRPARANLQSQLS